jgi:hypothetical protein
MNNNTSIILSCIGGAAVGSLITWFVTKKIYEKKYADIADKEIASVKEKFTVPRDTVESIIEKKKDLSKEKTIAKEATNKLSLTEYAKNIKAYVNYSDKSTEATESVGTDGLKRISFRPSGKIEIIEPDDYGEDEEYDQVSLTLYADGILADEDDRVINDVDGLIGEDTLSNIGKYEDDAIHVKNEITKCYYEVLTDERNYEKATGKKPPEHLEKED